MTGRDDYLPVLADSERALGRPDRALALVREANTSALDRATQIELRIVESGIRRDQGLADAAVVVLQVPELTSGRLRPWSARLFYAYADALLAAGRVDEARDAFARAAAADADGETDAADRLDELDGVELEDLAESDDIDDVTLVLAGRSWLARRVCRASLSPCQLVVSALPRRAQAKATAMAPAARSRSAAGTAR